MTYSFGGVFVERELAYCSPLHFSHASQASSKFLFLLPRCAGLKCKLVHWPIPSCCLSVQPWADNPSEFRPFTLRLGLFLKQSTSPKFHGLFLRRPVGFQTWIQIRLQQVLHFAIECLHMGDPAPQAAG